MNSKSLLATLTLALLLPVANATPITAGTGELIGFHPCIAGATACDSFGSSGPGDSLNFAGLPGNTSSSTGTVTLGDFGVGMGSATLGTAAVAGAPTLRAAASSIAGERVLSTVIALQSYTWNGQGPATRTFGGSLTYSQTTTGVYPAAIGEGVYAGIDIFTMSAASIDAGSTSEDNFLALSFADGDSSGTTDLGYAEYGDINTTSSGLGSLADTVTLTPGETIWVWTVLQAIGTNGSSVDASHTFVTSWDDATGLTPAATVPEPASFGLLLTGLAGCAVALRRRRRARRV